ncbi:hypothetical protein [Salipiger thiooxidans]|uniref:hypothetical protein n=1 Tax=Salipiger thiooxidans TaxID=282683 RepID=UPI001CD3996A|nr:hypothetical protein [Salipiger thiooxidans]MCA0850373.1 hypothetical protein [Salipiger thiooxidans]
MTTARTTATVQLTVQISGLSYWGEDCAVGQVRDHATKEAISKLSRVLGGDQTDIHLVKDSAKVTMIQTEL